MSLISLVQQVGFNPLNQVYVFNKTIYGGIFMAKEYESFNPLNQVYVFNKRNENGWNQSRGGKSFNPLNQVYVFNVFRLERQKIPC